MSISQRRLSSRRWVAVGIIAACRVWTPSAVAAESEVVSVVGRGEAKETPAQDWRLAVIRQRLPGGAFVRTGDASQLALLLADQTQLRLNQNSLMQLKALPAAGEPTRLELRVGRAWMQAKGHPVRSAADRPRVIVETPNATAAIRGTDWELVVDHDGGATLTVLSGSVELYNDFGRLTVERNEQARVEPGKAPVKVLLTRARERVQWVTAYRPQPQRWLRGKSAELAGAIEAIDQGRYAEAMSQLQRRPFSSAGQTLLLADLLLAQGAANEAIQLLEQEPQRLAGDGRFAALLSRAYLVADRAGDARQALASALRSAEPDVELWIAAGDLARFDGDTPGANAAYRKALAMRAQDAAAWFGLGVVASEREAVRQAREALSEALRIDPQGPGFRGELGTLETFADEFGPARAAFDAALADQPDDYVALTGLGVMQLKRGDTAAALQSFLKAGVMEPRFARAALYTGIAYYQLGRRDRAVEMLERAAELDSRDPLPHLMLGVVASDDLAWGEAIGRARAAIERLPYLKSLNQLLNNQKGNANVGSGIASFGLEDWAQAYAHDAYNPYWAGSHLFLADRFSGEFNKNSELFQGFITDPTVFGASNRFSTLVPRPGDYLTLAGSMERQDSKGAQVQAIMNGYHNEAMPFAYHVGLAGARLWTVEDEGVGGWQGVYTVGLGARPVHDLGLFLFANRNRIDARLTDIALGFPGNPVFVQSDRADLGVNFKLGPDSQSWLKVGTGRGRSQVGGSIVGVTDEVPVAIDIAAFSSRTRTDDWQWRHTMDWNPSYQGSLGVEYARQKKPFSADFTLLDTVAVTERDHTDFVTRNVYLANRLRVGDALLLQADIAWQATRKRHERTEDAGLVGEAPIVRDTLGDDRDFDELNPRLGLAWRVNPGQTLRLAWQKWRRPASVSTLGPVDTAGIALDDRLVALGGKLERLRGQFEWEQDTRTFWQVFADWRKIDNAPNPQVTLVANFSLEDLVRLRRLLEINQSTTDFFEDVPEFGAGRVKAAGFALNRIVSNRISAALEYHYHRGRNATDAYAGNAIPLLARHTVQLGTTWLPLPRWQLSGLATFRSARYLDEANAAPLASGWNLGIRSYWESDDKRFAFGALAENLLSRKAAGTSQRALLGVELVWRK